MAALNEDQIKQYFENPVNKGELSWAAKDNDRQLFHAMLSTDLLDAGPYLSIFKDMVKKILDNKDKFARFESNISFPLPSHNLISKATDELNKIFYAQDRDVEYNFTDDALNDDFEEFLKKITFSNTIEQLLFTKAKQCVNSFAIVDTSQSVEAGSMAEPYIYFVEAGKTHDVQVDEQGRVVWIMFIRDSTVNNEKVQDLIVIDDTNYTVAHLNKEGKITGIESSSHFLGYCPATFIWKDTINPNKPIRRYNSVLEAVNDMDKYVIASIFKEHVDLYASFPIVWRYVDTECEIDPTDPNSDLDSPPPRTYVGPGHMIEMSLPQGENAKMGVPVGFVSAERTLLDYNKEKIRELEVKITKHLTGVDNEIQNEKAFNESQVRSQYETRHSVLRYWAENIQSVHQFLLDTIAKIRYQDQFLSSAIDYGMDYFLYDTITATSEYQESKDAGLPMFIRAEKRKVVQQTLTRSSANTKARFDIMEQIEPFLDANDAEIPDKEGDMYWLKLNLQYYIDKFERENGSILKFASAIDFGKKIDLINTKLYEYVSEDLKEFQKRKDAAAKAELANKQAESGFKKAA